MSEQTVGLGDAVPTSAQPNGSAGKPTTVAPATTTEKKSTRGSVTSDPQLVACVKIGRILDSLDETGREFVLSYITNKYIGGN